MKIGFDYPGSSFSKDTKLLTGKEVVPKAEFNGKKVEIGQPRTGGCGFNR